MVDQMWYKRIWKKPAETTIFPQNADADSAEQVPEPADRGKFPPSRGRHAQQNCQGRGEPGEATEISHHPPTLVSANFSHHPPTLVSTKLLS